jgi:hypothetical protein
MATFMCESCGAIKEGDVNQINVRNAVLMVQ